LKELNRQVCSWHHIKQWHSFCKYAWQL